MVKSNMDLFKDIDALGQEPEEVFKVKIEMLQQKYGVCIGWSMCHDVDGTEPRRVITFIHDKA